MFNIIKNNLVVSCQALETEPLFGGDTMLKMATAAIEGGAVAIRTNGGHNTSMIKKNLKVPVIGLVKKDYPGVNVYITPTPKEVDEVCQAGCDMVAIDCTDETRPFDLTQLIAYIKNQYSKVLILADIATYEEAMKAQSLGVDAIAVTMCGYTRQTEKQETPNFDLIERLIKDLKIPLIAEGNFNTPPLAKKAIQMGAHSVVVGSAITRPQLITKTFYEAIKNVKA